MFENNDEFGIQSYRDDVSYVIAANEIEVKIFKYNNNKSQNLQSDYFGVTTPTFKDPTGLIKINVMSQAPNKKNDNKEGFDGYGDVTYSCWANYAVDVTNKDIIEFIGDNNHNIKAGSRFIVKLGNEGMYKGQYTYKNFDITLVDNKKSVENYSPDNYNSTNDRINDFFIEEDGSDSCQE